MNIKVQNMLSPNSGREVANQFRIYTDDGVYFQSYKSIIAFKPLEGKTVLDDTYWDYSVTTGRYRNQFLNENIDQTRKKIKAGEYELRDLNGVF